MKKPCFVIISDWIRRDLHQPLQWFDKLKSIHLYRRAGYEDMTKEEFQGSIRYRGPLDLFVKLWRLRPDIIQGPEPWASKNAFANALALYFYTLMRGTPFVFPVFENRPIKEKLGFWSAGLAQGFTKIYGHRAKKIIYLNEGAKKNLLKLGLPLKKLEKMNWGTWGIDFEEFKASSEGQKDKKPTLLFVGKVERAKGIPWLIQAFKLVLKEFKNAQLLVVGAGSQVKRIKRQRGIKYLGVVKNKDLPALFQKTWITVAPSVTTKEWEEQVGMVNLQSLACSTPVITTTSGAIPEYVPQEAAILVPEKNSRALAQAIITLLKDKKQRQKMGQLGRQYCLKHYEARQNIQKAQNLLLSLLVQS